MISVPTIFRASVGRFIPGVLLFLGCGLYFTARMKGITLGVEQMDGFTALTLFMTLGFVVILLPVRRFLRPTAGVDGRRGLLAGFASPIVLLALEMLHGSPVSHSLNYLFAFLAGGLTTMVLFAPWLSTSPVDFGRRPQPT